MTNNKQQQKAFPPQHQNHQPGIESEMNPRPVSVDPNYKSAGKLTGKTAIITGGDSGIGKSIAIYFAKEGADVAIIYLEEHQDAEETKGLIEAEGRKCLHFSGDIGNEDFCKETVKKTINQFGKIDI